MKLPAGEVRSNLVAGAVIAGAAGLAYGNSGAGAFVFDDRYSIVENASIRHLWPLWAVLTPNHGGMTVSGRPLVNLSLAVNYALGALDPRGYHLFNLIVHILAGLTLFGLLRRSFFLWRAGGVVRPDPAESAGAARFFALAAALLWTLHPLQTESVTNVVQRAEAMMGLFYLLTLYGFVRYAGEGLRFWGWVSVLACLLGMACKEVMISAPVIVLLCDRALIAGSFGHALRLRRNYYIALAATWLPLAAFAIAAGNRGDTMGLASGVRPAEYWLTQFHAVVRYLELVFWPRPLIFDYGTAVVPSLAAAAPAAFVVLLLAAASIWLVWHRATLPRIGNSGLLGLAGLWFFVVLAPTCIVPSNRQTLAEHRMYLALAPVLILAVVAIWRILHRHRRVLGVVLAGWAVALGAVTHGRNRDYRSELALYGDTVAKLPGNYFMQCGLGYALIRAGRMTEAEAHYREALRIRPDYAEAHVGLADALVQTPDGLPEAVAQFREGLRLNPGYFAAHVSLAEALTRTPDGLPEAVGQFREALRLHPGDAEVHNALAVALARIPGREAEAVSEFGQALRLRPDFRAAHFNLAVLRARTGQIDQAIREMEATLKLDPDNATVRASLDRLRALPR